MILGEEETVSAVGATSSGDWMSVAEMLLPKATFRDWHGLVSAAIFGGVVGGMVGWVEFFRVSGMILFGCFGMLIVVGLAWPVTGISNGPRAWHRKAATLAQISDLLGPAATTTLAAQGLEALALVDNWLYLVKLVGEPARDAAHDAYSKGQLKSGEYVLWEYSSLGSKRLGVVLSALVGSDWRKTTVHKAAVAALAPEAGLLA
jgi:hypothetical protein